MQHKQVVIAHAYYFLCEMIILFLLTYPFLYHYYKWVPDESYLAVLMITCIIYSLIAYKKFHPVWVWLSLPVLGAVFMYLGYPSVFAILFSGVFVIDYVIIHKQELLNREPIYIIAGIIITGILFLITNAWTFTSYLLFIIILVCVGYAVSHIAGTDIQARKQFPYRLFLYFATILTGFGVVFFLFANTLKFSVSLLWQLLVSVFTGSLSGLAAIIGYFFPGERNGWPEQDTEGENPDQTSVTEQDLKQYITDYLTSSIVILVGFVVLIIIILISIMVFKRRKKRKTSPESDKRLPDIFYELQYADVDAVQKGIRNPFRVFKKPEHPIRKLVFQFERKAEKNKRGRLPFETIGEWLSRIGMDDELDIYQQVRYGDASNVSEEETEQLKRRLKTLQDELGNK